MMKFALHEKTAKRTGVKCEERYTSFLVSLTSHYPYNTLHIVVM